MDSFHAEVEKQLAQGSNDAADLVLRRGQVEIAVEITITTGAPVSIGQKIKRYRLKLRKKRLQLAAEWGISPKTLWGWETNRWQPTYQGRERIAKLLEYES